MGKTKILIVDDHAIVRMGMVALLNAQADMEVVGEAKNGEQGVKAASRLKPDVVVMDILMPVKNGIEATREIVAAKVQTKVLVLTTTTSADELAEALEAGATGIIPKTCSYAAFLNAIRSVAAGRRTVMPEIDKIIASDPPVKGLTDHQLDILSAIVRGLNNTEIAKMFGVSPNTVRKTTSTIFAKLGAANRTEATAIAIRKHLLK